MSRPIKILLWSGGGLLAALALCLLLLLRFDWNLAKPWLNQRVSEATGRPFAINGDLSLTWHAAQTPAAGWRNWLPWPRLTAQQVTLGNPSWAQAAPNMAEIGRITFSLDPLPLLRHQIVIPSLLLDSPSLTLERTADGKNNWSVQSEQPSAWLVKLTRVELTQGRLRLVDAVKHADLKAELSTLPDGQPGGYGIGWTITGRFNGQAVSGNGKSGAILSLRDQATPYPLQADVRIGKTSIGLQGNVTRPQEPGALDMRLKLAGVSMAQLYEICGIVLPETRPYATEGRLIGVLNRQGGNWTYEKFSGKMGDSDLAGTLEFQSRASRPLLKGSVVSTLLQFDDLAPLIGADSNAGKARRDAPQVQPADKVLPHEAFKIERWSSIDAEVQFSAKKIVRSKQLPIDDLRANVHLKDGVVRLDPLNFGVAGGHLVSNITLDGHNPVLKADLKMSARGVKLKELFPTLPLMQASFGQINGDAALSGTGNSIAALLGSSNGELKATINQGSVSKLLLEELGLNLGSIVIRQLFGDRQVALHCLASDFVVNHGVMQTRAFVLDTDDATVLVDGRIDLAREQLDLTLKPRSKGIRLISLRAPIYLRGSFQNPDASVDKGVLALKAGGAVALAALAPVLTALVPLVNIGGAPDSGCAALLRTAGSKPVAPLPAKNSVAATAGAK